MTIFLSHARADQAAAEALEAFLERRGQFVELDDGMTALRPITPNDVLILFVSKDLVFAPMRLRLEQRALDAWADGRLIVVKLDHGIAPVGLRDLPTIDASFEAQRDPFTWGKVGDAVREKLRPRPPSADGDAPHEPKAPPARKRGGRFAPLLLLVAALPGLGALAAAVSIWLVNRIGPTPGGWPELASGIDAFGVRYGIPGGVTLWLFAAAILVTVVALAMLVARLFASRRPKVSAAPRDAEVEPHAEEAASAPAQSEAMFVSYARANQDFVLPVIDAVKVAGRKFWVDQQGGVSAGDSWAGEIVRAIRGAAGVVVMCSKASFESDHVKREVYLADRYHRRLVPVFIESVEPPEDFEYFFAGVQALNLFDMPAEERPQALDRMLGATS